MVKLTIRAKKYIENNLELSNRTLKDHILIEFGIIISHVAIGKYKRKIKDGDISTPKKVETFDKVETFNGDQAILKGHKMVEQMTQGVLDGIEKILTEEVELNKVETSETKKMNGYLEFIDNQEKYPVTITEFLNLLEKNKEHIYYQYFIKRLTKGSKSSRSEFMKFFEFIQDIF